MRDQGKRVLTAAIVVSAICATASMDSAYAVDGAAQAVNFFESITKVLMTVSGALAILFAIVGGIYYITSGGKFERADKAKTTLMHVGIGVVIVFAASAIVNVLMTASKGSFGG